MDCQTFIDTCKSMGFTAIDNKNADGYEYEYDIRIVSNNNPLGHDPFTVAYYMKQPSEEHAYVAVFCGCNTYHLADSAIEYGKRFIAEDLSVDELESALKAVQATVENLKIALDSNQVTLKQLCRLAEAYELIADKYPIRLQSSLRKLLADLESETIAAVQTGAHRRYL